METNQENIITLVFHNYSPTPVVQKWSFSTLRMLPFFDSLLDWSLPGKGSVAIVGGAANRSYIMDCDPNDFVQVIDNVRYGKRDKVLALSDSLGVKLDSRSVKRLEIPKKFEFGSKKAQYNLKDYPITKILSLRWIPSESIFPSIKEFSVCYDQKYHFLRQRKALVEKINEDLDDFGTIGAVYVEASLNVMLPGLSCSKELEMWLTLVVEYE